jgi:phage gpG-like protein
MANAHHAVRVAQGDIDKIIKKLENMSNEVYNAVADEIEMTSLEIETEAKKLCPVQTGRLRASITTFLNRDRLNAVVGTNVEYAEKVEFGISRAIAKPFLYPAWFNGVQGLKKRLEKITGE